MKLKNLINLPEYLTFDDVLLLPNYSAVTPSKVEIIGSLSRKIKLEVPVLASPMDTVCEKEMALKLGQLGGYGVIHRNLTVSEQAGQLKWVLNKKVKAGGAVGVGQDLAERVKALVAVGAEEVWIDSAHGYSKQVIEAVKKIKKDYPQVEVIAGNVATYEGAKGLFKAGADVVKVGMGPGSICSTRIMSGMGVPQLTAIVEAVRAGKEFKKPIIADGGIRASGDIVKALAAGAATVMLGSLLAGTDEAPGKKIKYEGKWFKGYRGMGSVEAMKKGSAARYGQSFEKGQEKKLVPEGVEGLVEYKGKLEDYLHQLMGGLRSGMAYLGAENITKLQQKARFIRISRAGVLESRPHSILRLDK